MIDIYEFFAICMLLAVLGSAVLIIKLFIDVFTELSAFELHQLARQIREYYRHIFSNIIKFFRR
jgi:hypothetical protein